MSELAFDPVISKVPISAEARGLARDFCRRVCREARSINEQTIGAPLRRRIARHPDRRPRDGLVRDLERGAVPFIDQREYVAADRHPRVTRVAGLLPGVPEGSDLSRLLNVERQAGLVVLERGGLQVHAEFRRPDRGRVGSRPPPDPLAQPLLEGFEP
jgi:hypothetical protein